MTPARKPLLLSGCWLEASVSFYVGFHWAVHNTHAERFFSPPVSLKAADALHNGCENFNRLRIGERIFICLSIHTPIPINTNINVCAFFSVRVVVVV